MSGFDQADIHYSDAFASLSGENNFENVRNSSITSFKEFILHFQDTRLTFIYRDQLKHNYNLKNFSLCIDMKDIFSYKQQLADKLVENPSEYLPLLEAAAQIAADEITYPRPRGDELINEIQVTLRWSSKPSAIRDIKSDRVSKLVKTTGVVVSVSSVKVKAVSITIQCRSCRNTMPNIKLKPGIDSYALPRKCPSSTGGSAPGGIKPQCPLDPFFVLPDKCKCVDSQMIKLQEMPNSTPTGEMPRHLQLYCDRNLVECVTPGNKITILGIYCIKKAAAKGKDLISGGGVGVRKPYLRVVGIEQDDGDSLLQTSSSLSSRSSSNFASEEEVEYRRFASRQDTYEIIAKSIAPSIYGADDIKKAVACLLFGGSAIHLPDGLTLRGDINVLLLGDPGTAKSQILKFAEKAAPIGLYTSGKGSSAAGLTASINRDPSTGAFVIEGGAMVLADGGCVCIDEFDKMREDDRVAIHEAMEQQTISIAKAGITTTLNSRCAVLAAANSVFGRWDDSKAGENINFMPTILSRFDMIFIVKDEHSEDKDIRMAKHVLKIHMQDVNLQNDEQGGELSIEFLRKYINFCKHVCGPRISDKAAERLKTHYIKVRNSAKAQEMMIGKRSPIVITVRQLEAISRIGESLAKMKLLPFVSEEHIEEAIRLFSVSTWDAANRGGLCGAEGFTSLNDIEEIRRIEQQVKQRFAIGTQVSQQRVVEDLIRQRFPEHVILRVLNIMIMRGELEYRLQGKVLYRAR